MTVLLRIVNKKLNLNKFNNVRSDSLMGNVRGFMLYMTFSRWSDTGDKLVINPEEYKY